MGTYRKYVNKEKPDVVLSFSAPFNMLTLTSLIGTKHKIVVAERVDPRSFHWGKMMEKIRNMLYRNATGILAQTQYCKDYFKPRLAKKTDIIFNPVLIPDEMIGVALKTPKTKTIVTAGRLEIQKNHIMLINAFEKFHKRHPDYNLIIYGEGSQRDALTYHILNKELSNSVFLPGTKSDLWKEIISAEMFVMTSDFEGMSNSMIEAMCLGLPCISTKVSGATDLIQNEYNGILINTRDEEGLVNSMEKIASNHSFAMNLGLKGSEVYRILNVSHIAKLWIDYINKIINQKN